MEGLQGFWLQVEISEITAHEANESNTLVAFVATNPSSVSLSVVPWALTRVRQRSPSRDREACID